jgi:hypothetical protein
VPIAEVDFVASTDLAGYPDPSSNLRSSLALLERDAEAKTSAAGRLRGFPSLCEVSHARPVPAVIASCFERIPARREPTR